MSYLLTILGSNIDEYYKSSIYPKEGSFSMAESLGRKVGGPPLNAACVASSRGCEVKVLDYHGPAGKIKVTGIQPDKYIAGAWIGFPSNEIVEDSQVPDMPLPSTNRLGDIAKFLK